MKFKPINIDHDGNELTRADWGKEYEDVFKGQFELLSKLALNGEFVDKLDKSEKLYRNAVVRYKAIALMINHSYQLKNRISNQKLKKSLDRNMKYLENAKKENHKEIKRLEGEFKFNNRDIKFEKQLSLKKTLVQDLIKSYLKLLNEQDLKDKTKTKSILNDLNIIVKWYSEDKFPSNYVENIDSAFLVQWLEDNELINQSKDKICSSCRQNLIDGFELCFHCYYINGDDKND